jgi:hypothetical protein
MKTVIALLVFTLSLASAFGEEEKGVYKVTTKEVILFSVKDKPEERLALLFTSFLRCGGDVQMDILQPIDFRLGNGFIAIAGDL